MIGSQPQGGAEQLLAVISFLAMIAVAVIVAVQYVRDRPGLDGPRRSARNWNLLMVGLLAFTAGDVAPDLATETEALHRTDEIAVVFIAAWVVAWYLRGRNRFLISITPLVAGALFLMAKLGAIIAEIDNKADVEGDIVLAAVIAPLLVFFAYTTMRRQRRAARRQD